MDKAKRYPEEQTTTSAPPGQAIAFLSNIRPACKKKLFNVERRRKKFYKITNKLEFETFQPNLIFASKAKSHIENVLYSKLVFVDAIMQYIVLLLQAKAL